ncbi:MAG: hypothetical protein MRY79_00360 [Alphaproteobacteria bacterium]|nr:hypothetical protein [Alphaproteobacteria bacterium]
MIRFIYGCMAVIILSFVAIPIYHGVSTEKARLEVLASVDQEGDDSLSFEEIYEIASEGGVSPEALNNIEAAAGGDTEPDKFTTGFSGRENSALADIEPALGAEETTLE